jgi:FG-GAP-like repeat
LIQQILYQRKIVIDGPVSIAVDDFNGDTFQDLAIAIFNSNNVSILLGNDDGTFDAAVPYGTGNRPLSIAVGNFN